MRGGNREWEGKRGKGMDKWEVFGRCLVGVRGMFGCTGVAQRRKCKGDNNLRPLADRANFD